MINVSAICQPNSDESEVAITKAMVVHYQVLQSLVYTHELKMQPLTKQQNRFTGGGP